MRREKKENKFHVVTDSPSAHFNYHVLLFSKTDDHFSCVRADRLNDSLNFDQNIRWGKSSFEVTSSTVALIKTELGGKQQCRWFRTL